MHFPSSPDFNELFSYVKYYLKARDDILQTLRDPKPIIKTAFDSVDAKDCFGWIHDC